MTDFYWTYIYDGEVFDADFGSKKAAQDAADSWWAEQQADNEGMSNGDTFEADIELIGYKYDDDGERSIVAKMPGTVEYEHYHGDLVEHGTWG